MRWSQSSHYVTPLGALRQTRCMREHDVIGADGTRLCAWTHGDGGPPVLISPGLGTIPEAWPSLLDPSSGVTLHSWYHRGTFGSGRPVDPARIGLDDHVADGVAVLGDAGVDRCLVVGWSVGVSVAVQLALQHPQRVSGLLLVAGVPGGVFDSMGGMTGLPDCVRAPLARTVTRTLHAAGPVFDAMVHRLPVTPATVWPLRHSGLMLPAADPEHAATAVQRFARHDWRWYFGLALAVGSREPLDLAALRCPVTVLAGRYDLLADVEHLTRRMAAVPQARLRLVPASHFLPLEAPDVVLDELRMLQHRAVAVDRAVLAAPLTRDSRAGA